MYTREWLIGRTRFYQNFGFFEEYNYLLDEELADEIIRLRQVEREEAKIEKLFIEGYDWLLLILDKKRVLSAATDILYAEEPPEYDFDCLLQTIDKLSAISRGAFSPENIQEVNTETIEFVLNGERRTLTLEGPPDDPLILASQINPMILTTGFQFKQQALFPDVHVYAMTAEEIENIGWKFLPERWMFDRE